MDRARRGRGRRAERPANVVTTYGITETGSGVVYDGAPLDGVDVAIADDGEIRVRGPMLLRAYRDGTSPLDPDGWFPTGDLGGGAPTGACTCTVAAATSSSPAARTCGRSRWSASCVDHPAWPT